MSDIRHGVDGWSLADMDWDPDTGVSRFEYQGLGGTVLIVFRDQPTRPDHQGWSDRQEPQLIYIL